MAANALVVTGNTINLTFDGSVNDLDFATYFPNGIRCAGVIFDASASTDIFILKQKTDSGVMMIKIVGTGSIQWSESIRANFYLDYSACTFGTPASCKAVIQMV